MKEGVSVDDKKTVISRESDNLGVVIKQLVDFDAQQRALISAAVSERENELKTLEAQRAQVNEEYMARANARLEDLSRNENAKAEKAVAALESAAQKNIAELERTAQGKSDEWVEQIYQRVIKG